MTKSHCKIRWAGNIPKHPFSQRRCCDPGGHKYHENHDEREVNCSQHKSRKMGDRLATTLVSSFSVIKSIQPTSSTTYGMLYLRENCWEWRWGRESTVVGDEKRNSEKSAMKVHENYFPTFLMRRWRSWQHLSTNVLPDGIMRLRLVQKEIATLWTRRKKII